MARKNQSTAKQRQPNDVQAELEETYEDRIAATVLSPEQQIRKEARDHCESLGIDPESVSDAVRMLSKKFKQGPLEILWDLAADPNNSKTSRSMCAQAILPYLTSKPEKQTKTLAAMQPGVMIVPASASMEEWAAMASAQQAALKEDVQQ